MDEDAAKVVRWVHLVQLSNIIPAHKSSLVGEEVVSISHTGEEPVQGLRRLVLWAFDEGPALAQRLRPDDMGVRLTYLVS